MKNKVRYTIDEIISLYNKPFMDLIYDAIKVHRTYHNPNKIQVSSLMSIKTGGCPEDCGYCPQASRYHTEIEKNNLMSVDEVVEKAKIVKEKRGASRICLGAAWRNVKEGKDFEQILEMIRRLNKMDMEVCCTLGMLTEHQVNRLAEAGLYAYNHNLDTSEEYYKKIISTRGYRDRLRTIKNVRNSNITVCSGGIIGMGETLRDRAELLYTLSNLNPPPESVPINALVAVKGTPMENQNPVPIFEMVRMVAVTRIVMPFSQVRLSAGRKQMTKEGQSLCFLAGANSIFAGDKLLTTPNSKEHEDLELFEELGLTTLKPFEYKRQPKTIDKENSAFKDQSERQKWSRPGHIIENNVKYSLKKRRN